MDEFDVEENRDGQGRGLLFLLSMMSWFIGGGIITWAPALSHNIDKHAGLAAIYTSWISWCVLPVSILFVCIHKNLFTSLLLRINLLIWLSSLGWVWYKAG